MKKILFLTLIVLSVLPFRGQAQATGTSKGLQALHKLAARYQQPQFLSFDVLFRYATETQPTNYLDSLSGQYKLHGNQFWSMLDGQLSVCDTKLQLMVFEEDSLLMLTRPGSSPGVSPVSMLDSFLLNQKEATCQYTATATEEIIEVSFPATGMYRKISWYIDTRTGYLNKMVSVMTADQLYDPSVRSLVSGGNNAWVIVETLYSHYRQAAFDEVVFDLGRYIKKEGESYTPVAPYEKYKVFLGSSGL